MKKERRKLVYIAGPYTQGDVVLNVKKALEVADALWAKGYVPHVPHITHFWHFLSPKSYDDWMVIGCAILERSDLVLRLPGVSKGAVKELRLARSLGIPVYYNLEDIP